MSKTNTTAKPLHGVIINDSQLTLLALEQVVTKHRNIANNKSIQLDESTKRIVQGLASMPFSQALQVATETIEVHVHFNEQRFNDSVRKQRILSSEQDYFEWMIATGASNSMLDRFFPALSNSVTNAVYRKGLSVENSEFKRVVLISDEAIQQEISEKWFALSKQLKLKPYEQVRELYLAYEGKYNLTQLYAVLKLFDLM